MKRAARRFVTKHPHFVLKLICIVLLFSLIVYLKSNADAKREAKQQNSKGRFDAPSSQQDDLNLVKPSTEFIAHVLVFCSMRPDALRNHLSQLLRQRPTSSSYKIVISQDGNNGAVRHVANKFKEDFKNVSYIQHERVKTKKGNNYPAISAHYKWALDKVFFEMNAEHVIVTEDDLDIGNDFFSYFQWGKKVLDSDKTVWCISAWNDNGARNLVNQEDADKLWRTDFFPGLGWMLTKSLWEELSPIFPSSYWDDWMRSPSVRKNRSCIRPELSRTSHNMKLAGKGSSGGLFKDFLSKIEASKNFIEFMWIPTSVVEKSNYDKKLAEEIKNAKLVNMTELHLLDISDSHNYKVAFDNVRKWNEIAKFFKIMTDIRGGMQRTAYYGVVTLMYQEARFYIVPEETANNPNQLTSYVYDEKWDKQNRFLEFEAFYCKSKKYTGKCDPHSPEMFEFFTKKGWKKRLADWGEMIVV
ncbi:unnamed protein product [Caenorhabditis bovis]|uniref:Alpha-1,3-mannosyl-glycoprotein 2-beta-N-acetylglucosaminyltransferase n=1 Tax=Caenorhabditis bovis TaxID=2654633 RepID=A0A8S1EIM8_9PELO|nr:unnamed protein product [Caenorhabditis bovis]